MATIPKSTDINALLDSKIEELKTAEPTARRINLLFKSVSKSLEQVFEAMYNSYIDTETVNKYSANVNYMLGPTGLGAIVEGLTKFGSSLSNKSIQISIQNFHRIKDNIALLLQDYRDINADIQKFMEEEKAKAASSAASANVNVKNPTNTVSVLFTSIVEIVKSLTAVGASVITIPIKANLIRLALNSLKLIIYDIANIIDKDKRNDINENINTLANLIKNLNDLSKSIFTTAVSITLSIPFLVTSILGIALLKGFVISLVLLSKSLDNESAKRVISFSNSLKNVAFSLLTVSLAFLTLSLIISSADIIPTVILFVAGIALLCAGIVLLTKMNLDKDILTFSKSMTYLAGSLVFISLSLILISEYCYEIDWNAITALTIGLVFIGLAAFALSFISKDIKKGATALLITTGVIVLVALSLIVLQEILEEVRLKPLIKLGVIIGGIILITLIAKKLGEDALYGALALIIIAGTMYLAALTIQKMNDVGKDISLDSMLAFFGVLIAMVVSVIGLGALLFKFAPMIPIMALGLIGLISVTAIMKVVADKMKDTIDIAKQIKPEDSESIKSIFTVFGTVVDKLTEISLFKLAEAAVTAVAMRPVINTLSQLADVIGKTANLSFVKYDENGKVIDTIKLEKEDFNKVKDNVAIMLSTLVESATAIAKTPIKSIIDASATSLLLMPIISSIGLLAKTVIDIASARIPTAWDKDGLPTEYKSLNDIDLAQVTTNVKLMLDVLKESAGVLNEVDFTTILKASFISDLMNGIVDPISKMVDLLVKLQSGQIPLEWDEKTGKPTKYGSFNDIKMDVIKTNLTNLVTGFADAIKGITGIDDSNMFGFGGKLNEGISSVKALVEAIEPVSSFIDGILKIDDKLQNKTVSGDIAGVINSFASSIESVTTNNKIDANKLTQKANASGKLVDALEPLFKIDDKGVANHEKFINNNIKFLDKVNGIDTERLKGATDLFKQMAEFSKTINGNFDKLADAFSEKMLEVLESIDNVLKQVGDTTIESHKSAPVIPMPVVQNNQTPTVNKVDNSDIIKQLQDIKSIVQGAFSQGIKVVGAPGKPLNVVTE